jgi:hypothetical protein
VVAVDVDEVGAFAVVHNDLGEKAYLLHAGGDVFLLFGENLAGFRARLESIFV